MTPRVKQDIALAILDAIGIGFVYEMLGNDPRFLWIDSISWQSYHHPWVFWMVFIAATVGPIIFLFWWWKHGQSPHAKLYVSKKRLKEYEDYMKKYGGKGPHV
jgi:hypothetical protein